MDYEELFVKAVNRKPVTAAALPVGKYRCAVIGGRTGTDTKGHSVYKLRLRPDKFPDHTLFKDVPMPQDEAKCLAMVRIFEKAAGEQFNVIASVTQYRCKDKRVVNLVGEIVADKQLESADSFDGEDFDQEVPF